MIDSIVKLKQIEKRVATDKKGRFKRLKFMSGDKEINLIGKTIEDLNTSEIIQLKKFTADLIDKAMDSIGSFSSQLE